MQKKQLLYLSFLFTALLVMQCRKPILLEEDAYDERLNGGSMTVFDNGVGAYGHAFPMSSFGAFNHDIGDKIFEAKFVTAPASVFPGLGPLYNHVACASCHINDGRGKPTLSGEQLDGMLFRCSAPGIGAHGAPASLPGYGLQLQTRAVSGTLPECKVTINYTEEAGVYPDGTAYSLRKPIYIISNPYTALPSGYMISPRIAPPVFGLGLIGAIADADILKNADETDADGDGISGRANYVWDTYSQSVKLGRFGWKANEPTLLQQSADALNGDMGITTFINPIENCNTQPQCNNTIFGKDLSDSALYAVTFYLKSLMVPARRNVMDERVQAGKVIFNEAKCNSCHTPVFRTATDVAFRELSNQRIQPYADFLLHDMGSGLADGRPDFLATGNEWRTPPLWGIGLTEKVNGHTTFLHDGRARNIAEAILWHGGEAEKSKNYFMNLSKADREKLLLFINSL